MSRNWCIFAVDVDDNFCWMAIISPFSKPLYVMVKPAGAVCNLNCTYCYYLEKNKLYKNVSTPQREILSEDLLEEFIRQYIGAQTQSQIIFTWHGGEPLMRPMSFYRKVMALQQKYARGRWIDNCLQTNGTMLTDEWCQFLKDNQWLVGVSVDGPREYHDAYRRSRGGTPSFERVMHGIELLKKYGVEWNAMAVVNDLNSEHPLEFYRFFKEIGAHYIQFSPIVERFSMSGGERHLAAPSEQGEMATFSVTAEKWGNFLCTLFDEWVRQDVGKYFIQLFDAALACWVGEQPGVCLFSKYCGHAGVMEHNGDVYSCDHFVFPEYKLGNIRTETLTEMMYGKRQQEFGERKQSTLPTTCRNCQYLFACNGECPKNRFLRTENGETGLNYLCAGYHRFFEYIAPYMDFMKNEWLHQRPPANVMQWIAERKERPK